MWRMKVSASIQNSRGPLGVSPLGSEHLTLEVHVVGAASGVNAVKSCLPGQQAHAGLDRLLVERDAATTTRDRDRTGSATGARAGR